MHALRRTCLAFAALAFRWLTPPSLDAQIEAYRLRDCGGSGVASSQFATYVLPGELVVYPYYEYYRDRNAECKPSELGFAGNQDYFGRYHAHEGLIFLGYGISRRLMIEMEAAVITAHLEPSPDDPSAFPVNGIEESGLGDVEAQLRYRWREDSDGGPEVFSYFESVFPFQKDKRLIGTSSLELKYGMGVSRSTSLATFTVRAGAALIDGAAELGEYALEAVRGVTGRLRVYCAVEGSQDEVELLAEAQALLAPGVRLKVNSAFGLTQKATGWAPEIGVLSVF